MKEKIVFIRSKIALEKNKKKTRKFRHVKKKNKEIDHFSFHNCFKCDKIRQSYIITSIRLSETKEL